MRYAWFDLFFPLFTFYALPLCPRYPLFSLLHLQFTHVVVRSDSDSPFVLLQLPPPALFLPVDSQLIPILHTARSLLFLPCLPFTMPLCFFPLYFVTCTHLPSCCVVIVGLVVVFYLPHAGHILGWAHFFYTYTMLPFLPHAFNLPFFPLLVPLPLCVLLHFSFCTFKTCFQNFPFLTAFSFFFFFLRFCSLFVFVLFNLFRFAFQFIISSRLSSSLYHLSPFHHLSYIYFIHYSLLYIHIFSSLYIL